MDAELLDTADRFLREAGPLLLADEARHNLALGVAGVVRDHPEVYPERRFWVVREDGRVLAAALRTPPYGLILARPEGTSALEALAATVVQDGPLPNVVGALPEVEEFTALWAKCTGATATLETAQGIYALRHVTSFEHVPGAARLATIDDRPLLLDWMNAFAAEALPERDQDPGRHEGLVDLRLGADDDAGLLLWELDRVPVSLAGFGSPTASGIRIGPVYTPPELRRRGFASALTADLSQRMLDRGYRFCFLYTDLSNPFSNKVYLRIGYEFVCESADYSFST